MGQSVSLQIHVYGGLEVIGAESSFLQNILVKSFLSI